jgi:hypothetical protein
MKNPPILVSVIGFFAAIAGIAWLLVGAPLLGVDWLGVLSDVPELEPAGIWGWLGIIGGVTWLAVAGGLWSLRPWAWGFAMVVGGLLLFDALLWILTHPGSGIGIAMAIMPLVVVLYLNGRDVKGAFGLLDSNAAAAAAWPEA